MNVCSPTQHRSSPLRVSLEGLVRSRIAYSGVAGNVDVPILGVTCAKCDVIHRLTVTATTASTAANLSFPCCLVT